MSIARRAGVPRRKRIIIPGAVYHAVNRGNDKRVIFPESADYEHFLTLLVQGRKREDINIFGYSLMPTHFHLLIQPGTRKALPDYMHWVQGNYAVDLRVSTGTLGHGHVFQRRYFAANVEDELGCLVVLAYIEMNARAAQLVQRAEEWPWSSLSDRSRPRPGLVSHHLLELPANWNAMMNLDWNSFLLALVQYQLESHRNRRWY